MKLIAHRGYSQKYPENTMIAFEKAIVFNADMIELDVTLTQDQKIVVIHDDTLDRTTDGKGKVRDHTYEQIQKLDAGSWFDPQYQDQKVPLLSQVLQQFGTEIPINIEIKKESVDLDEDTTIEPLLWETLQMFPGLKQIQVSSFEPLVLHRMRRRAPSLTLCYLNKEKLNQEQRDEMRYLECAFQHICIADVDQEEVEMAQKDHIGIQAFTIYSKEDLQKAQSLQLDGVFINDITLS